MSSKPMHSTSGSDATAVGMHTPTRPLPEVFAMPQSPADEIRHKLLGAWSLVSWESFSNDGTQSYPLGEDAVGQLMYDDTGRVSTRWFDRASSASKATIGAKRDLTRCALHG